jgi:hypothetical protein
MSDIVKHVEDDGTIVYTKDGRLHNEDGPAMVNPDGSVAYFIYGDLHNLQGPAITAPDGYTAYFAGGLRHNPLGPAVVTADGEEFYYFMGYNAVDKVIFESEVWRTEIRALINGVSDDEEGYDTQFDQEYID